VPGRHGSAHQNSAPYQSIRAGDGWFTIGATSPRNWHSLCHVLGLERLEHDPRYADTNVRLENRQELIAEIEAITSTKPVDHWIGQLEKEGVPCAPLQDFSQSFNEPHLLARDYFWDAPHTTAGMVRQLGSPMRFSVTEVARRKAGPLLGEDTRAVLQEIGCTDDDLADLLQSGVVAEPQRASA
jgi:formyl-CoA transferase